MASSQNITRGSPLHRAIQGERGIASGFVDVVKGTRPNRDSGVHQSDYNNQSRGRYKRRLGKLDSWIS